MKPSCGGGGIARASVLNMGGKVNFKFCCCLDGVVEVPRGQRSLEITLATNQTEKAFSHFMNTGCSLFLEWKARASSDSSDLGS